MDDANQKWLTVLQNRWRMTRAYLQIIAVIMENEIRILWAGYAGELMPSGLCDVTEPLTPALKKEGDASEAATAFQRSRDPAAAYRLVPHP